MMKDEAIFVPFWSKHYTQWFAPEDLYVHDDGSTDATCSLLPHGTNIVHVKPGDVPIISPWPVGRNDIYIKDVITRLLERYECVLFAESPDDIIVPGENHSHDLKAYVNDFIAGPDPHRFLTCYNVTHDLVNEPPYDPARGPLLSQRHNFIRCNQYDNPFLWKSTPTWGYGWHNLGGKRITGGGDTQGDDKRLYNLHIHYADFDLCNARHLQRQTTYAQAKQSYACSTGQELKDMMNHMVKEPSTFFSEGALHRVPPWMHQVI